MSQLLQYLSHDMPGGQQGSPTMSGYGFNWYGGQPTTPEGGYYNQMAQMMAGPSYGPAGSNFYSGGSPVSGPSAGAKGALPEASPQPIPRAVGMGMRPLPALRQEGAFR